VLLDDDALIVNLTHAPTAEEVDAELSGAEADAGIERDASVDSFEDQAGDAAEGGAAGGEDSEGQ